MTQASTDTEELLLASLEINEEHLRSEFTVPGIKCAGCINKIESSLAKVPGVVSARVNLSTKRVTVDWDKSQDAPPLLETLKNLGFDAYLSGSNTQPADKELRKLIRALAVAGFGAANIMMLSVGVWAGAGDEARELFHWLSAAIALPVMIYSGNIFYSSAWLVLKKGRTNMDVPISVGVAITFAMSLYDTFTGGAHAYFDAATSLLFFLLIGRTLDHVVRARAHSAITSLQKLAPEGAAVIQPDGSTQYRPLNDILPGMRLRLPAGGRVPVNGTITKGGSDIDHSIINGESEPRPAREGDAVLAGALNLTGPLVIEATSTSNSSFISDMIRLMEKAESARHGYQRIADRVSRLYAPVVHVGAILAFLVWFAINGNAHQALTISVSVLIITCPCALGLAVPMVQVTAAQRLYRNGVLIKSGEALEKLAEIDSVVFDKTGTLTEGTPRLHEDPQIDDATLSLASSIAAHSLHPYSRALARAVAETPQMIEPDQVTEHPGKGIEATINGVDYRLGRPGWAAIDATEFDQGPHSMVVLGSGGRSIATFRFTDTLRPSANSVIRELQQYGMSVEILSGDRRGPVAEIASFLSGVPFSAEMRPENKLSRISALTEQGRKVLMVGDGVNDAPALAAAYTSMAPASAADIGRTAADIVFLNNNLDAVINTLAVAQRAKKLMRQNIALSIIYNAFAVPLAFLGFVTPLVAAIAMSASSVLVVLNSLRLGSVGLRRGRSKHNNANLTTAQIRMSASTI